jgi:hypothetical protein
MPGKEGEKAGISLNLKATFADSSDTGLDIAIRHA